MNKMDVEFIKMKKWKFNVVKKCLKESEKGNPGKEESKAFCISQIYCT